MNIQLRNEKNLKKDVVEWISSRKFLTVLILCCIMQISIKAFSQSTVLSLDLKNVSIEQVLNNIEAKTTYHFLYNKQLVDVTQKVTIVSNNLDISQILDEIFKGSSVSYSINGKQIVLSKVEKQIISQSKKKLSGTVTDKNGDAIIGATVMVEGTSIGVTTDKNGYYSLALPADSKVIVFSFIGMKTQKIIINGKSKINITMNEESITMNEIVVIGYGEKKRENMTGSVSSVNSKVLESRPIVNTIAAIQGIMPGLTVQRSSGQPGAEGFNLNVRGFSSVNGGNSPLVLIDGVSGDLNLLNPADIESISVLKDASASIYGARAANGVFLVTTKKGKKGTPKISYSGNFATTQLAGMMDTPNTYQMAIMDNEANIHNGAAPMYTADMLKKILNNDPNPIPHPVYGNNGWMLFFTSTDWKKAVFKNGFQQKHTINVSGGGESSTYYLSGSYADQEGVIRYGNNNNKQYNLRMNYDYDFSKRVRLETKVSYENQVRSDIGGVGAQGIMYEAIFAMPNVPIYTKSGDKYFAQGGWGNAVAQAKEGATSTYVTRNIDTNFKLIIDVLDGLKLNLQSGINSSSINNKDIANSTPLYNWDESKLVYYSIANPNQVYVNMYNSTNLYKNFTGYFQYNKSFAKDHKIDFMGGVSYEGNSFQYFSAQRTNFTGNDVWALNLGSTDNMTNNGGGNQWAIESMFSRLSYNFKDKYLLEANLRYDGSSRFAPNTRWGLFPGISVGWRLSEESFIKDLNLFDNLKLRASYGQTGNQEGINLYDYYQLISIGRGYPYPFGAGGNNQSAYLSGMVSPNRTWETIATSNAGIDMTLLSSKLDFSFDYFIKNNNNMLIPVTYPSMLGAVPPASNAGNLRTTGFETSIKWTQNIGELKCSAKVILSDATNVLVNYGGQDTYTVGLNTNRQGYPLNSYFVYTFDGLIRTQTELDAYKKLGGVPSDIGIGDAKFKDVNGDGKISAYSDVSSSNGDLKYVGNSTPRFNYGLNLDFKWKNFDLGLFFQGVGKRTIFREGEYSMPWSDWWRQPPLFYYGKTWNEDRPNAEYPRLSFGNIRYWNYQPSTLTQVNAAYLRLKNLQFGYTLPTTLMKKLSIARARVYFSGFDLAEISNVKGGWDPESSTNGFNYPFQRLYSFGIDVTF